MTTEELITIFRKETEDLIHANNNEIYLVKNIETSLSVGANSIAFSGDAYDDADDYKIDIYSAIDGDGIDVTAELTISGRTSSGFVITAITACDVKITTSRKTPKFNYWT